MKVLILFTSSFPFGTKETYLETEIKYLSNVFDIIHIYPFYYNNKNKTIRFVPQNVEVHPPVIPLNKGKRFLKFIISILSFTPLLPLFYDFYDNKVFKCKNRFGKWLKLTIDFSIACRSAQLRELKKFRNSIFYYYWGHGWANTLTFLEKDNSNKYFIRLHGGDSYLERASGYIPLRLPLFKQADFLLPISQHLSNYLKFKYNLNNSKIELSKLGTNYIALNPPPNDENSIHIVSCSNVIELKRIDLIVDILGNIKDKNVHWIHVGDGILKKALLHKCSKVLPSNITYTFTGRIANSEILKLYSEFPFDAFINVSKHEGVPVSLMEAMSFGIPCIATNAGATNEIVNNENGLLLPIDFNVLEISKIIINLKSPHWKSKRQIAFDYWINNYSAEKNYTYLTSIFLKTYK